jgi:hypothetical protein
MEYDIWDSEEEAAGVAAAMEDDGGASPAGVQFPDGRTVPAEQWAALADARAARERAFEDWLASPEPRPKRKITAPFGGGQIEIGTDEPTWLGVRP